MTCKLPVTFARDGLSSHSNARRYRIMPPSFSHSDTEITGAQGVDALNVITGAVVAASVRIHQKLGPGLLESVYEVVLARDLVRLGFRVERQRAVSFEFEGTTFDDAFRPELIINHTVIVEVKAARALDPVCSSANCSPT